MPKENRIECSKVDKGFEFPAAACDLDARWVTRYLDAVDEQSREYLEEGLVPPMAAATYAMSSLGNMLNMPPGAIHVSQSFDFLDTLRIGDRIVCHSKVIKKRIMGDMALMAFEITITDRQDKPVLKGTMDVMLTGKP